MTTTSGTRTLQTTEPITKLRGDHSARTLSWFADLADCGDLTEFDPDPPYQRGHVWGDHRRRLLILSLMQGLPIGAIIINDRPRGGFHEPAYGPPHSKTPTRNWAYSVIDGKQRITTLAMWMRGDLAVPASWFPTSEIVATEDTDDGPYVRMTGLLVRQRRFFSNIPVPVVTAQVRTLAEERDVFVRINSGGVAQGDSDEDA